MGWRAAEKSLNPSNTARQPNIPDVGFRFEDWWKIQVYQTAQPNLRAVIVNDSILKSLQPFTVGMKQIDFVQQNYQPKLVILLKLRTLAHGVLSWVKSPKRKNSIF